MAAPADAVVFQGTAHAVIGHHARLQADAAARAEAGGEERAELTRAAVGEGRPAGLAVIPVRREGAHDRLGVTSVQRRLVAADDITGAGGPGLEDGGPQAAPPVDRPYGAVGAEHHRPVVRGLGDDRHRPRQFPPVMGQVRQQLYHGPVPDDGRGHGLDPGVTLVQEGLTLPNEPAQLPMTPDLAGMGIVDDHLTRPHRLQGVRVALVQRGEVLPDRIGLTGGASLPARQLHRIHEVGQPWHRNPTFPFRPPGMLAVPCPPAT